MNTNLHELFLRLVRLGIGHDNLNLDLNGDWEAVLALAEWQGLRAVVAGGHW